MFLPDLFCLFQDEPEDDDDRQAYDIMRATLRENYHGSADATMGSGSRQVGQSVGNFNKTIRYPDRNQANALQSYYSHERRPTSVRSTHSMMSAGSRTSLTANTKKNEQDGDLLKKHSHVFTETEKPFTPRTLKSNRHSRLSEYKYYTAPPKKQQQKDENMAQTERKMMDTETSENRPKPKPKPRGSVNLDKTGTQTLTESQLIFETLQTRDSRHFRKGGNDRVPKLDISMDKDHMNWIQEQASKAELRMKNGGIRTPMDQIEEKTTSVKSGSHNEIDKHSSSSRQTK